MIPMPRDAPQVEHQQMAGALLADQPGHLPGEPVRRNTVEATVRVPGQFHPLDAQFPCGAGEFVRAQGVQVAGPAVQGGRLAVGEAEHSGGHGALVEQRQEAAQAERLVVGMGDHRRHAPHSVRQTWPGPGVGHLRCR
ncbi:hypothetical protein RKD20_001045 [Streptomyces sp. SLBN-8D4]